MRGATASQGDREGRTLISIHAPHAGSDVHLLSKTKQRTDFNPRSPCGERLSKRTICWNLIQFQSTLPMRGATEEAYEVGESDFISIHAPHAGSDGAVPSSWMQWTYFNPRSPCGERLRPSQNALIESKFQSTLPMRGATVWTFQEQPVVSIFQSTLPMRGATRLARIPARAQTISIHAPHAGSDYV